MSDEAPRSYYGRAIIKPPVWKPEIPWYLFSGGLGGGSAGLAYLAGRAGNDILARRAWLAAMAGVGASPLLLISDLGYPSRFLNMLRMFKVTSPMSVGSWVLVGAGATTSVAAAHAWTGLLAGPARVARPAAALLGLPLSTYTGALLANTAVPIWHEARESLPVVFAAGAAASAGAAATVLTPTRHAAPARRLALIGSLVELGAVQAMEHHLGDLAEPYHGPDVELFTRGARLLTATGALLIAGAARRSRAAAVAGGALVLAGALSERWSVFKSGFQSAGDPKYTVGPQRARIRGGRTRGASRRVDAAAPRTRRAPWARGRGRGGAGRRSSGGRLMPGPPTDVEVNRALNALATTIADQRYRSFDLERFQQIVDGALSGERKLVLHRDGDAAGFVARAGDGLRIADVELVEGRWNVERRVTAADSEWARPR